MGVAEPAPGLFSWTARHPEWHPGEFGAEVVSFAARGDEGMFVLLDPLLPEGDDAEEVLELLDREAGRKETSAVSIQISVGYHARSAETLWDRYRGDRPVTIHGHKAVMKRLGDRVERDFGEIEIGAELPGGTFPQAIGKPRRQETPLWIPAYSALLFGDTIVGVDGTPRTWAGERVNDRIERFYRERFNPTVEPLIELGAERLLFTHGTSVLSGGSEALREGVALGPWHQSEYAS